jgi:hypothetical protein
LVSVDYLDDLGVSITPRGRILSAETMFREFRESKPLARHLKRGGLRPEKVTYKACWRLPGSVAGSFDVEAFGLVLELELGLGPEPELGHVRGLVPVPVLVLIIELVW